ncbi:DNA polymerase-3 subunit epsilon [Marinobacter segnicrescens]|uniref:DNA-directed DNA polymerase n=1 Tax=Marinobacter segnicrescens TaxID=430453 RepID=A0A1H9YRR7_9GAMM|nr:MULTISPECIES: 3'-5' exonuclease [Marinobacter]UZD64379.1 3'-5' exonuclease [Marinobacter sp. AN1]SES71799.1 DNA polymerase-3 subunit epsilon [Marinobacter segnicrescens]
MLDQFKNWINGKLTGTAEHHDVAHLPPPKSAGGQHLDDLRFIVLDLETTGLNPAKDKVIAIGAVAIDRMAIPLSDQFDLILRRPELDIRETVLIHGIGPEALTRGHETQDALLRLLEWMNGDPVLAFHSAFDRKFLEKALRQQLNYSQTHTWLDVAELMPAFFPHALEGNKRLDNWADHFGLEISARHHAAADALATAELSLIAFREAREQGVVTLDDLHQRLKYHQRLKTMRQL